MYKDFFQLTERPFNLTPDTKFFFSTRTHQYAFEQLLNGIKGRKGFIKITGEIGAGKTTLCRTLLNKLDPSIKTALILNPSLSPIELLQTILEDLGLEAHSESQKELIDILNNFLIEETVKGNNVAVIIDEAQNLSASVLEEIRLLSNLETEKEKLLQIVLVGQNELNDILDSPNLVQLKQRIAINYHITPLNLDETIGYIKHRLFIVGGADNVNITNAGFKEIYKFSGGIPRKINLICDKALSIGALTKVKKIDKGIILQSSEELEGLGYKQEKVNWGKLNWILKTGAIVLFIIFISILIDKNLNKKFFIREDTESINEPEIQSDDQEKIISLTPKEKKVQPIETSGKKEKQSVQVTEKVIEVKPQSEIDVVPLVKTNYMQGQFGSDIVKLQNQLKILGYEPGKRGVLDLKTKHGFADFIMDFYKGTKDKYIYEFHLPYKLGAIGRDVFIIQKTLAEKGFFDLKPTGFYGKKTVGAISAFQRKNKLYIDGILGIKSAYRLFKNTSSEKYLKQYYTSIVRGTKRTQKDKEILSKLHINQINSGVLKPNVVIDGKRYKIDDSVNGVRIIKISNRGFIVEYNTNIYFISVKNK